MVLVDTSIWIELLNGHMGQDLHPDDLLRFAVCPPVLQEVLQGLRDTATSDRFRDRFLALPSLGEPVTRDLILAAADLFRVGRQKGYTIRSSLDYLIAAIAIAHRVPIWHNDRYFATIARFTGLRVFEPGGRAQAGSA